MKRNAYHERDFQKTHAKGKAWRNAKRWRKGLAEVKPYPGADYLDRVAEETQRELEVRWTRN